MRASLIVCAALFLLPVETPAQVELNPDLSVSGRLLGTTDYDFLNHGIFSKRQTFDHVDYYSSSSPGVSGTVQTLGDQRYGQWNDGTRSRHQTFDGLQFHTFRRGNHATYCTSQRVGDQIYTNCR